MKVMELPECRIAVLVCGLGLGGFAMAEEAPLPDAGFLEYLGMWDEMDEDWLMLDELVTVEKQERSDAAPENEESTETENES